MYPQYESDQNMQFVNDQHLHHRNIFTSNEMDNQVSFDNELNNQQVNRHKNESCFSIVNNYCQWKWSMLLKFSVAIFAKSKSLDRKSTTRSVVNIVQHFVIFIVFDSRFHNQEILKTGWQFYDFVSSSLTFRKILFV